MYFDDANDREKNKLCPLEGIVPSPTIDGYRNKCEFTIGVDVNKVAVVGMTCGKFVEGITAVEAPDECKNTPKVAISCARLMTQFVRNSGTIHSILIVFAC
jgi:tRNA (uracil-5-)-methyltransferase